MIPKHEELIDTTLRLVEERARVLQHALHCPVARGQCEDGEQEAPSLSAPSIELLRESLLGQQLR